MISETLLASRAALQKATLFKNWVRDNPKESARVENYWQNGGDFPATATQFGLHYALDAKAYHASLSQSRVIAAPAAGAGAETPPTDGADVSLFPASAFTRSSGGFTGLVVVDLSLPFIPV